MENSSSYEEGKQALRDMKSTLTAGAEDVVDEARGAVDDLGDAASDIGATARRTASKVGARARRASAVADVAIDEAGDSASDAMSGLSDVVSGWKQRAIDEVREEPLKAVGIAAGVGIVLGLLLRGRRA